MAEQPRPQNPDVNVNSALPDDVRESVAAANFKVLADGPAFYQNMGYADAVAHQRRMNVLSEAVVAQAINAINRPGTENAALTAAMAQILTKNAQTTPPDTAAK